MTDYQSYDLFPESWVGRRLVANPGQTCEICGAVACIAVSLTHEKCLGCLTISKISRFSCKLDPSRVEFILDAQVCD